MIKIRDFEYKDIDGCLNLLRVGHTPDFTRARFEWLHFQSPLAPSRIVVAELDSQIIGIYSAIKKQVNVNGTNYVGARDVDPVVHPRFRNRGIFLLMLDYCLNNHLEIDFHFNFANAYSMAGFLKKGWKEIGCLPECLFQVDYDKVFSKKFVLYAFSRFRKRVVDEVPHQIDFPDSNQFNHFLDGDKSGVSVVRSYDYLKWRYFNNPMHKYYQVAQYSGSSMSKLAIGRSDRVRGTFVLNDCFISKSDNEGKVDYLINFAKKNSFESIRTWQTCNYKIRSQMIYNPNNTYSSLKFLVRKREGKNIPDCIFNLKKWLITPGDLEIM